MEYPPFLCFVYLNSILRLERNNKFATLQGGKDMSIDVCITQKGLLKKGIPLEMCRRILSGESSNLSLYSVMFPLVLGKKEAEY